MWPKEKLLIMSNFTFNHNVFKSRLLLLRQKASACGKGLRALFWNGGIVKSWHELENLNRCWKRTIWATSAFSIMFPKVLEMSQLLSVSRKRQIHHSRFTHKDITYAAEYFCHNVFICFTKSIQSRLLQICCMWERVNSNLIRS